MSDDPRLEVSASRIQQLVDVLSLLSLGQYDPALTQIQVGAEEDQMALLEQSLSIFVRELSEAHAENDAHISQLEHQRLELERKLELINRQRAAISELSTPILELWDEVVTLPIIGLVDTGRSLEITERLLQRISDTGCRYVIIDVTGLDVIDTMTTDHFVKMIRSAQLLGAHCVVTGMSSNISQTMVGIGAELGGVTTLRTLKEGLKHCLRLLWANTANG
ncbi:RsbR, positive regulator of sigma-B [Enhygromyxa salina]|uniref:RsbR, positive regulator of sigma-B n=1 Tax=Enhygromyxa salina TaxID=215803 RepID=A0A0C2D6B9_9BACT|nr:STAS domain-containing protein [Enhygromyxa salina]KIG15592.1 RsbR, positive regulator of sigma-B [Enhygromyxa salina]